MPVGASKVNLPFEGCSRGHSVLSGFPSRLRVWSWVAKGVGPVAQLGERLVCIQEVVGSNPVASTSLQREKRSEGL